MRTRLARPEDLAGICRLIDEYAAQGLLLPRTADDVCAHREHFLVLTERTRVDTGFMHAPPVAERLLGCVALEPYGATLAETRSLAVDPVACGRGLSGRLIAAALAKARRGKIARVFAVTHAASVFKRHGFFTAPRQTVPEKLARDCHTCPKARHCELVEVVTAVCPDRDLLPLLAPAARASAVL